MRLLPHSLVLSGESVGLEELPSTLREAAIAPEPARRLAAGQHVLRRQLDLHSAVAGNAQPAQPLHVNT